MAGTFLIGIGVLGSGYNGKVSCIDASFGNNSFFFLLIAAASTLGFIFIFMATAKEFMILQFYGRNSLIVLCTHMFYVDLFWMLNSQIFHLPLGAVDARLFALGVILLEVPTILVVNRYFPWLIGLRRKQR